MHCTYSPSSKQNFKYFRFIKFLDLIETWINIVTKTLSAHLSIYFSKTTLFSVKDNKPSLKKNRNLQKKLFNAVNTLSEILFFFHGENQGNTAADIYPKNGENSVLFVRSKTEIFSEFLII